MHVIRPAIESYLVSPGETDINHTERGTALVYKVVNRLRCVTVDLLGKKGIVSSLAKTCI